MSLNRMIKKMRVRGLIFVGVAIAAAGTLYAELKAGLYSSEGSGSIHQTLPQAMEPNSTYEAGQYLLANPELAKGDGVDQVYTNCMACHSTRYILMQPPLPAATWSAEVTKMNKAYGAGISDADVEKIVHYLQEHYTPETRKE
jgi:hypothetical protein